MLNLFNILLENIDYEQLIEEGKDPVQVLHYKFQNVPSDIIDSIIAIDPTKKKSYTQWTLSKWDNEDSIITSALQNGRLEKLFQFFKEHQEKQIKDCPSVSEGLDAYVPKVEDTVLDKSSEPETYVLMIGDYVDSDLANDFDIVFNEDNWLIAVPNTYEASCKLGENCWWCTANHYGNGESYYREYLSEGGKYYINFDLSKGETLDDKTRKEYPYTRYQFHFESHQFKAATQGEPDVTVDDLNIPESAIDFYHEIDESYDIGGKSLEEQMYEYEGQRYSDAIRLNDDLYLNVEYDDNYEYHEPNLESDSWYVFDNEDDRDPISYTVVKPNGIKHQSDDVVIIESEYDEEVSLALIKGAAESRWRDWGAITITKYAFVEGYDDVFFALSCSGGYKSTWQIMFARGGHEPMYEDLLTEEVENLFINTNFNDYENTYGFIEIILEDGYHSLLYGNDNTLEYVIHKDIPINGKYFTLTDRENGDYTIQCEFRTYDLWDIFNEGDSIDYRLERKLDSGDYLVTQTEDVYDRYGSKQKKSVFNVLDSKTRELIFDFWADNIEQTNQGYIVTANGTKSIYNFEGEALVNGEYDKIVPLIEDSNILVGVKPNNRGYDLIDEENGETFAEFASIDLSHKPANNKIIVSIYEPTIGGNLCHIYDYVERKITDGNYDYLYPTPSDLIIGRLSNDKGFQIFNYKENRVLLDNIVNYEINKLYKRLYLTFYDGKQNIINFRTGQIYSPINFDNFIDEKYDIVEYKNDGKIFFYDYENKKPIFREDGIDYQGYFHMYGTINFSVPNTNFVVGYQIKYDNFKYGTQSDVAYYGENVYNDATNQPNAPQEVIDFVNYLQGNDSPQQVPSQQEEVPSMAENFKRMLNRINEARKLNRREIYD